MAGSAVKYAVLWTSMYDGRSAFTEIGYPQEQGKVQSTKIFIAIGIPPMPGKVQSTEISIRMVNIPVLCT